MFLVLQGYIKTHQTKLLRNRLQHLEKWSDSCCFVGGVKQSMYRCSRCHDHLKAEVLDLLLGLFLIHAALLFPFITKCSLKNFSSWLEQCAIEKKKKKEHNKLQRTKLFPQRALIPTIYLGYCLGYNEVIYLNRMDPTWFAAIQSAAHYNNATIRWQLVHNNVLHLH